MTAIGYFTRTDTVHIATELYPVTVENLNDDAVNARVDEAYRAKYAGQGTALRQAVSPQVRARTMRITPRSR